MSATAASPAGSAGPAGRTGAGPLLRVAGLRRDFVVGSETVQALRDVTLAVGHNEYVAIMGPSGSGKSTLMNILGCLDAPTAGDYWLDGTLVSGMSDRELARVRNREIGFVFQTFNLLPRASALRNVELPLVYAGVPAGERRRRAVAALDRVRLGERMHHRPNELSGGQQQRVAIARSLVGQPALILADEPTGNLDSRTGAEVIALLEGLHAEGQTLLVVTHDQSLGRRAQRRIVLRDGEVESDESTGAVARGPESRAVQEGGA